MSLLSRLYALSGVPTHAKSLLTTTVADPRGRRKLKAQGGGGPCWPPRRSRSTVPRELGEIDTGRMPTGSQLRHYRGGSRNNEGGRQGSVGASPASGKMRGKRPPYPARGAESQQARGAWPPTSTRPSRLETVFTHRFGGRPLYTSPPGKVSDARSAIREAVRHRTAVSPQCSVSTGGFRGEDVYNRVALMPGWGRGSHSLTK